MRWINLVVFDGFLQCSVSCGYKGLRTREVRCVGSADSTETTPDESLCSHEDKPTTHKLCFNPPCSSECKSPLMMVMMQTYSFNVHRLIGIGRPNLNRAIFCSFARSTHSSIHSFTEWLPLIQQYIPALIDPVI